MLGMELPRLTPAAEARISRAVAAGASVSDPEEAAAAALFARVVQQRVRGSMWRTALRVSIGSTVAWLVFIALPLTLITGLHPAALIAGIGVGLVLFSLSLLLADRQLRFAVQAEQRNRDVAQRAPQPVAVSRLTEDASPISVDGPQAPGESAEDA